jgi:hypothetical protein
VAVAAQSGRLFWLLASASPAAKISKPAAQKSTQQQQALTQAPSTNHRAAEQEQEQAGGKAARKNMFDGYNRLSSTIEDKSKRGWIELPTEHHRPDESQYL